MLNYIWAGLIVTSFVFALGYDVSDITADRYRNGQPLAVELSGANRPDIKQLLSLVVHVPPVRGKPGRPRSRPDELYADRAYDSEPARGILRWLGIEPFLAKRGTEHGSGLGKFRWVSERTISWFRNFRRLRVRYERRNDIHEGFLGIAKNLICLSLLLT